MGLSWNRSEARGSGKGKQDTRFAIPLYGKGLTSANLTRERDRWSRLEKERRARSRETVRRDGYFERYEAKFESRKRKPKVHQLAAFRAGIAELGQQRRDLSKNTTEHLAHLAHFCLALPPRDFLPVGGIAKPFQAVQQLALLKGHVDCHRPISAAEGQIGRQRRQ